MRIAGWYVGRGELEGQTQFELVGDDFVVHADEFDESGAPMPRGR